MKISVVIPTCNRPGRLDECLRRLAPQLDGAPHCPVIVVDDHSQSSAQEQNRALCRKWKVRYLLRCGPKGVAACRNDGIRNSSGEWIAFLDDDVVAATDWYHTLREHLAQVGPEVIGLEGAVLARGDGIWDREVQNLKGGLYLSCHIVYRRDVLERIGGFDEAFKGPYGEDHELAVRALEHGRIEFVPALTVTHSPRQVELLGYLRHTPRRMRLYLDAERHFASKHPDRYGAMRHAKTFWGTYRALVLKNLVINLRRRSPAQLARHPLQCATLVIASIMEQLTALVLLPRFLGFRGKARDYRERAGA